MKEKKGQFKQKSHPQVIGANKDEPDTSDLLDAMKNKQEQDGDEDDSEEEEDNDEGMGDVDIENDLGANVCDEEGDGMLEESKE